MYRHLSCSVSPSPSSSAPEGPIVARPSRSVKSYAWKAASTKLKKLGEKKINMQKQVDNAKDTLRGILKEMQSLQEQINLAQKELDQATLQYQAKVVQTQDKTMAEYDVEKILQDFGIVLSPEQQAKLGRRIKGRQWPKKCQKISQPLCRKRKEVTVCVSGVLSVRVRRAQVGVEVQRLTSPQP